MSLKENVFSCSWQKDFGIHKVQAQLWQFCKNMTPEEYRPGDTGIMILTM